MHFKCIRLSVLKQHWCFEQSSLESHQHLTPPPQIPGTKFTPESDEFLGLTEHGGGASGSVASQQQSDPRSPHPAWTAGSLIAWRPLRQTFHSLFTPAATGDEAAWNQGGTAARQLRGAVGISDGGP